MTAAAAQEAQAIDLTLTFDPAEVWPDPLSCPDWPLRPMETRTGQTVIGERMAREQLELVQYKLARTTNHRPPTAAERKRARAHFFRDTDQPQAGDWSHSLGLRGVTIRDRTTEDGARAIVEGLHIRGYIRKLERQAERDAQQKEADARRRAQHRVDTFSEAHRAMAEEFAALEEAEKRHLQRLADEQAVGRRRDLKSAASQLKFEARRAASELGVELPEVDDLT